MASVPELVADCRCSVGEGPVWEGQVRSARPGPLGLTVEVVVDDLLVVARIPPPVTPPLPSLGDRVRFSLDPAALQPLGSPAKAERRR